MLTQEEWPQPDQRIYPAVQRKSLLLFAIVATGYGGLILSANGTARLAMSLSALVLLAVLAFRIRALLGEFAIRLTSTGLERAGDDALAWRDLLRCEQIGTRLEFVWAHRRLELHAEFLTAPSLLLPLLRNYAPGAELNSGNIFLLKWARFAGIVVSMCPFPVCMSAIFLLLRQATSLGSGWALGVAFTAALVLYAIHAFISAHGNYKTGLITAAVSMGCFGLVYSRSFHAADPTDARFAASLMEVQLMLLGIVAASLSVGSANHFWNKRTGQACRK